MLHLAAQPLGRATTQLARDTLAAPPGGVTRSIAGLPAESSPGAPQDREAAGSPGPGALYPRLTPLTLTLDPNASAGGTPSGLLTYPYVGYKSSADTPLGTIDTSEMQHCEEPASARHKAPEAAPPPGWDKDLTPSRAVAPRVDSPENPTPAAVPAAGDLVLSPVSKIRMARGMPSTVACHPGPQLKVLGNRDIGAVVASIAARRAKQA